MRLFVHHSSSSPISRTLPLIDKASVMNAAGLYLHLDFAAGVVCSARNVKPLGNVTVRSTIDLLNVHVTGGVVVAYLVSTVVFFTLRSALGGRDLVVKRHATESESQYSAQSCRQCLMRLPFRVEDDLAALFGRFLIGAAVEQAIAVGVEIALLAATTQVEAAELLVRLLVVVGEVVGLLCADVDAGGAGSAAGHDHGATTVFISLVLLRNLHLVVAGHHLRGCVCASRGGSRVEEVRLGVRTCLELAECSDISRLAVKVLAMGVHAGTHRRALGVVEERTRDLPWRGLSDRGIVPVFAVVDVFPSSTDVCLRDVGT
jgi:hypothetical protein